ncbi:Holliday junction resolvase Hjc [Archaeoglobus veneficus]|uniref:Crossover junction endodeoxyribonuclease Hjc n=1 Tax=Archaeoglobus veneficus (strain DSM 11195 / SNP6) TaxID=693661 RepID=F2KMN9_ARCVS|nr:Holliday junction resolvase Hjc [Archaeoglobus veneficus]AEA47236.1 Resolvase, Holliday junction-type [Archaeoglobus veneficus SNP6]
MKGKGTRFERELIHRLWENGFAAVRSAGSGAMSYPMPDIVAGNGKKFLAFEVKMRAKLPLYLTEQEVKELVMFSNLFGAESYIAVKIPRSDWVFVSISQLKRTGKGYKIDEDVYAIGSDLDEVLGRSVQLRLEGKDL